MFMDEVGKDMKARVVSVGVEMCIDKIKWKLSTTLFADYAVILIRLKLFARISNLIRSTVFERKKLSN